MDYRKILIGILLFVGFLSCNVMAQKDSFSWGALDLVSTSSAHSSAAALDMIIGGEDVQGRSFDVDALDVIISSERESLSGGDVVSVLGSMAGAGYRAGALDYINRVQGENGFYSSGNWTDNRRPAFSGQYGGVWGSQITAPSSWGRITSNFGFRPRFGRMHKGVDIAMAVGDTVCVPLAGVVDRVSYEAGGYGNYIVVKHEDGFETRYAHLSVTMVYPGQSVASMQPIALSGNTGNSTGPHLHFETRINGEAIDPCSLFSFAGGRMIPISRISSGTYAATSRDGIGALDQVTAHGMRGKSLEGRRTYVVRVGDTLNKIAGRAGISVRELCRLNMISENDELKPGTMIRLSK